MELNPRPELPARVPESPAGPTVVPMLPTRLPPGGQRPLPDPQAVQRMEIPDSAPPLDGDEAPGQPGSTVPVPDPQASDQPDEPPDDGSGDESGPGGPGSGGQPGPPGAGQSGWPSQFAQVLAETLAGSRPARQLTPWTTEQTRRRIRQLGPMLSTGQRPRVRRIMTSAPSRDVLEMTAVVGFGSRVRVLALRLERGGDSGQQWRCTALESA